LFLSTENLTGWLADLWLTTAVSILYSLGQYYYVQANTMSTSTTKKVLKPNRLTTVFKKMKADCPDAIRAYAACVEAKHNAGSLKKGSCEAEYSKIRQCFKTSLRSLRPF